jgi:hypothetical protein
VKIVGGWISQGIDGNDSEAEGERTTHCCIDFVVVVGEDKQKKRGREESDSLPHHWNVPLEN